MKSLRTIFQQRGASTARAPNNMETGRFAGPIAGLKYCSPSGSGFTNDRGEFAYRQGEAVTFLIGDLILGTAVGAPYLTLSHLVHRVAGRIDKLHDPIVTNLSRFVQSLDQDGNVENGVTIAPIVHEAIRRVVINFDQVESITDAKRTPGTAAPSFEEDPAVLALFEKLNATPGAFTRDVPRKLRSAAVARNELRRNMRGIVKSTDVKIPLRDGSFVYADVFRPADDGKYPVVMCKGVYGKSFHHECICCEADALAKEELEDRYFSGGADGLQYENHESVDTSTWVPRGYVCIRVDGRGVCNNPGVQSPLSVQEAEDYYDAIEWAGAQTWSNGNVGLWGMSYLAMTQHNVASLRPPCLKAMIAQGTDSDIYNEAIYGGGIFSEGFWNWWSNVWSKHNACGEKRETDWMARMRATPFNEPDAYGPRGSIFMTPEIERAIAPVWIVGPQGGAVIHQLGSSETFRRSTGVKAKKFSFVDAWFPGSYKEATLKDHMRFFDYWLKGSENGVMDDAPVRIEIRTGSAAYYVLEADEWPVARTDYRRLYLDASPSDWEGDGKRKDFMRITKKKPAASARADYEAQLDIGRPIPAPLGTIGGTPRGTTGVSFVSEPLTDDLVVAGYMKAGLWVSSTSTDMDVFVSLRVLDERNQEVRYEAAVLPMHPVHVHPVGHGVLKVSHRKLDEKRTTDYLPVHSHRAADYQPLRGGEVVPIEVCLFPSTAKVRKGWRLRVDIQPYSPEGLPARAYDESYHTGATNTVYTGPDHPSYIQLPIIPD